MMPWWSLFLTGCRTEPPGPAPGDVVIAFQSRAEGEIEPCG
ncbi:MAG: hypothetical protein R3F59_10225 [Myxococcota bacterium]